MYVMPSHTKTCSVYGRPPMCELSLFHGENTGSIPVGRAKHIMAYVESLRDGHRSAELRWTPPRALIWRFSLSARAPCGQ
jgi:hypothetical protein